MKTELTCCALIAQDVNNPSFYSQPRHINEEEEGTYYKDKEEEETQEIIALSRIYSPANGSSHCIKMSEAHRGPCCANSGTGWRGMTLVGENETSKVWERQPFDLIGDIP